mmetsp:Transcript_20804/g.51231  ORF Transcript_20804/g.51231 Transcript_20804/m.51231 type:complete len:363 (+) Transcript_20804:2-1090(+)
MNRGSTCDCVPDPLPMQGAGMAARFHDLPPMRVRLDRPPPRRTDWMNRSSAANVPPSRVPRSALMTDVELRDLPGGTVGAWQVSKSGRYLAPELPCPYLEDQRSPNKGQRRRSNVQGMASTSTVGARRMRRSRSVPPQAVVRNRAHASPLAAACRAYASARASGQAHARHSSVLDSIIAADAVRVEQSMADRLLTLQRAQIYQELWAQVCEAADAVGLDPETYAQLWDIQHRDIEPEDYDVLQKLEDTVPPKTLSAQDVNRFTLAYVGSRGQLITKTGSGGGTALPEGAHKDGAASEVQCSVCLEEYHLGDVVRILPCRHFFHRQCIDSWLTESSTKCPADGVELQHQLQLAEKEDDAVEDS